jgi:hypothetical protein
MQGHGKIIYDNGCTYDGEFDLNKKHGTGEFVWPDERKYTGSWFRGKQHGKGVMVSSKGEITSG